MNTAACLLAEPMVLPLEPLVISTPVQVALSAAQVHATLALSAGEG